LLVIYKKNNKQEKTMESFKNISANFPNTFNIIIHAYTCYNRFAGKLLIEMTVVPDVINDLIESNHIGHFAKLLMREEDIFMQEYLSAVLAKLSEDPYGNALLANHCLNVSILFERFQSPDPDIKRHNLQILHNLMHDPVVAHEISKSEVCYVSENNKN